jgi:Zn-dependent protease
MEVSQIDGPAEVDVTIQEQPDSSQKPPSALESAAIDRLRTRKKPWYTNIFILLLTLGLFFSIGMLTYGALSIIFLLIVLGIHELGHYYAMKTLGYTNVTIFFVPLGGAVMFGSGYTVSAGRKALISLAGPIPGIVIGIPVAIIAARTGIEFLHNLAVTFFILNAFNLLPFFPLDGGAFLYHILFYRSRVAEILYKFLAGGALIALGIAIKFWFLPVIGLLTLISIPSSIKKSKIADKLKDELEEPVTVPLAEAPSHIQRKVVGEVVSFYPNVGNSKQIADIANESWERYSTQPLKRGKAVGLFFLYFVCFLMGTLIGFGMLTGAAPA